MPRIYLRTSVFKATSTLHVSSSSWETISLSSPYRWRSGCAARHRVHRPPRHPTPLLLRACCLGHRCRPRRKVFFCSILLPGEGLPTPPCERRSPPPATTSAYDFAELVVICPRHNTGWEGRREDKQQDRKRVSFCSVFGPQEIIKGVPWMHIFSDVSKGLRKRAGTPLDH